jgi:carboxymethylenebutenolidase
MPGWDEWYKEATRRFAHHGYAAFSPNLYHRTGHGTPEDVAAKVRAEGGVPDDQVVADVVGSMQYLRALPYHNGKVGVIGSCSGGRQTMLVASRAKGFDAAIDCWGGGVVMAKDDLTPARPVAPIDYTKDLSCPLLGLFGEEDRSPTKEQVAMHEEELKKNGKDYEFHMYPNAGHGFFYYHSPMYRQEQAVDGWKKVWVNSTGPCNTITIRGGVEWRSWVGRGCRMSCGERFGRCGRQGGRSATSRGRSDIRRGRYSRSSGRPAAMSRRRDGVAGRH